MRAKFSFNSRPKIPTPPAKILAAGLAAARANLVPGLLLQAAMVGILVAYSFSSGARAFFGHLVQLKADTGYAYAFVACVFAGGLLPELLRITVFQRFRVQRENFTTFLFAGLFWGGMGVLVDAFYRLQAVLFGTDPTLIVVLSKVLFDMLVFTPFIGVPLAATAYTWKAAGYRAAVLGDILTIRFYRTRILPVLIPNWAIWGPVVCVIYALPSGLQIPVYVLAQAFWTLMLTTLTARKIPPTPQAYPTQP